ncbi:AAA family ATPase [Prevotella corporis]|uniref:AAA family ATPase n=1 Tax=Prevotella corporis TaxID=28128 RepID=UPI0023F892A6|nr:AAA family ATPase [Prevotella corporis]
MKITFRKIEIKNFKGVKDLKIEFSPLVANILGANHTGKTTTADAIFWVLFGKNSEGLSLFGIDPKDENNNVINRLENSVTLTISADNRELVLKKVRKETWGKSKGQLEEILTGHTTECYINGNKYTIKDYQAEVNALCNEALFRAITNPAYFPSLKAEEQRALLIKMVGDIPLSEIAKQKDEFKQLIDKLDGQDLKEYRSHLSYQIKGIKTEMESIPNKITENQQILQGLSDGETDFAAIRKRLNEIDEDIKKYDDQLQDASAKLSQDYEKKATQRQLVNSLKYQQQEIVNKIESENRAKRAEHENAQNVILQKLKDTEHSRDMKADALRMKKQELQQIELRTDDFRKKWEDVESKSFVWNEDQEICPHCGQRLPSENIEELKEKAHEQWTVRHMAEQDRLDVEAKALKDAKQRIEAELNELQTKIDMLTTEVSSLQCQENEQKAYKVEQVDFHDNDDWKHLSQQIEQQEAKLNEMCKDGESSTTQTIKDNKQELIRQRDELNLSLSKEKLIAEREERIEQLTTQMKQLNQQLTDLERKDYTAANLELASIQNLEERVNKLFILIKFKMFETLLNGSTKPTCVLTMHGVPYNDLSNSEKINAGIDLIRAMNTYNDMYAPIIIDNAESCNDILPTSCQQIRLVVSRDEQLTVVNEQQ